VGSGPLCCIFLVVALLHKANVVCMEQRKKGKFLKQCGAFLGMCRFQLEVSSCSFIVTAMNWNICKKIVYSYRSDLVFSLGEGINGMPRIKG